MTATATAPVRPPRRAGAMVGVGIILIVAIVLIDATVPTLFDAPLPTRIQDALTLTLSVLIESLPFVVLGIVLSVGVQLWVPASVIQRVLPRAGWARRAVLSLLGMLIPVCECGNLPFARGLLMRGIRPADALTFLVAAPIVNPIVILTTHQAFGWDGGILVARFVGGFLVANLVGWLYSRHPDPEAMLTARFAASCGRAEEATGSRGRRSILQFVVEARAVMPALIIGSGIAGAVQVIVPRSVLVAIGSNPVLSVLAMMLLAVTVAICSNVDAFFALSFASTFSSGSLVAFLIVGPIVDIKMLALMRTTFTGRVLTGIVLVVLLAAFVIGIGVNLVV